MDKNIAMTTNEAIDAGFRFRKARDTWIITEYIGKDVDVVVPQFIDENLVTQVFSQAFLGTNVEKVYIPFGVTKLDSAVFFNSQLKEIVVPDTVIELEYDTFKGTKEELVIKANYVSQVAIHAEDNGIKYEEVSLPTLKDELKVLTKDLQEIDSNGVIFVNVTEQFNTRKLLAKLEDLDNANGKTDITVYTDLGVTTDGSMYAYNLLDNLLSRTMKSPINVKYGYAGDSNMEDVNLTYKEAAEQGFILNEERDGIKGYTKELSPDVVIPTRVDGKPIVSIDYGAFSKLSASTLKIPNTIESIDVNAFLFLQLEEKLNLPHSLKVIHRQAFRGHNLNSVSISNTDVKIEDEAFRTVNPDFTIECEYDSSAHRYARREGIKTELTGEPKGVKKSNIFGKWFGK